MPKAIDVPISHIAPFRDRDRDAEKFKMLVASLDQHGLIEPLILAPNESGSKKYRLIAGHGRLRAAKRLGWQKIIAVVRDKFDLRDYIVENWRQDLSPYEGAVLVEHEIAMGRTREDIAKEFAITVPVVDQYVTIIRGLHPDLQKLVKKRTMTMRDAHKIAKKLPEQKAQETIVQTLKSESRVEPTLQTVKRAVEDVLGAVKVRGSASGLDSVTKLEEVKAETKSDYEDTNETLSIIRSHWMRSVGELRLLLRDRTYRVIFDKHGIDFKAVIE